MGVPINGQNKRGKRVNLSCILGVAAEGHGTRTNMDVSWGSHLLSFQQVFARNLRDMIQFDLRIVFQRGGGLTTSVRYNHLPIHSSIVRSNISHSKLESFP